MVTPSHGPEEAALSERFHAIIQDHESEPLVASSDIVLDSSLGLDASDIDDLLAKLQHGGFAWDLDRTR